MRLFGGGGSSDGDFARLEALERRVRRIEERLGIEPEPIDPELAALVDRGDKIAAIKRYRTLTGAGLRAAKLAVEAIERERRAP